MLSIDTAGPWRDLGFVAIDTETTGLDAASGHIIEIALVRFERGQVVDRWSSLIDPGVELPAKVTELTGITDAMVRGQPTFRALKWQIYGRLRDRLLMAYNADFDLGFLRSEFARCGLSLPENPTLDPLVWARRMMPTERSHKLGRVAEKLGIPLAQAHRATDDAEAAARVLLRLADKVPVELGALLTEQAAWKAEQEAAFAARRARAEPAAADDLPAEPSPPQAGLFG